MDSKGEESKMSYPNIFFMIDNFEEVKGCFQLVQSFCGETSLSSQCYHTEEGRWGRSEGGDCAD